MQVTATSEASALCPADARRLLHLDHVRDELAYIADQEERRAVFRDVAYSLRGQLADQEFAARSAAEPNLIVRALDRAIVDAAIDAAWSLMPVPEGSIEGALAIECVEALLAEHAAEVEWERDCAEQEAVEVVEARESRTSWHPHDPGKYLDPGAVGDPPPVALVRTDGVALFYTHATNALYGESESMKSWIAQFAAAQSLKAGGCVMYIDFEASGSQVFARMLQMGVEPEVLRRRFAYVQPDEPLGGAETPQRQELRSAVERLRPDLVVIDGVTGAMTMHGLEVKDNGDCEKFDRMLPRWIADAGIAVVLVDHVTKSKDDRGGYALGGQHKRAAITGAAYTVHKKQEFGRGRTGIVELRVSKDRAGHVSGIAVGASRRAAHIVFTSLGTDEAARITVAVNPPDNRDGETFRPTALMERLSRWIEDNPDQTTNAIMSAVTGNRQAKGQALTALVDEKYVYAVPAGRNGKSHASIRPYRQEADPDADAFLELVPNDSH